MVQGTRGVPQGDRPAHCPVHRPQPRGPTDGQAGAFPTAVCSEPFCLQRGDLTRVDCCLPCASVFPLKQLCLPAVQGSALGMHADSLPAGADHPEHPLVASAAAGSRFSSICAGSISTGAHLVVSTAGHLSSALLPLTQQATSCCQQRVQQQLRRSVCARKFGLPLSQAQLGTGCGAAATDTAGRMSRWTALHLIQPHCFCVAGLAAVLSWC